MASFKFDPRGIADPALNALRGLGSTLNRVGQTGQDALRSIGQKRFAMSEAEKERGFQESESAKDRGAAGYRWAKGYEEGVRQFNESQDLERERIALEQARQRADAEYRADMLSATRGDKPPEYDPTNLHIDMYAAVLSTLGTSGDKNISGDAQTGYSVRWPKTEAEYTALRDRIERIATEYAKTKASYYGIDPDTVLRETNSFWEMFPTAPTAFDTEDETSDGGKSLSDILTGGNAEEYATGVERGEQVLRGMGLGGQMAAGPFAAAGYGLAGAEPDTGETRDIPTAEEGITYDVGEAGSNIHEGDETTAWGLIRLLGQSGRLDEREIEKLKKYEKWMSDKPRETRIIDEILSWAYNLYNIYLKPEEEERDMAVPTF